MIGTPGLALIGAAQTVTRDAANTLADIAAAIEQKSAGSMEDVERRLTVLMCTKA